MSAAAAGHAQSGAQEPMTYAGGGSVNLGKIEEELAGLWRQAGELASERGQALTRACLWNLIECQSFVTHGGPEDKPTSHAALVNPVDEACATVPSRMIRLRARPPAEAPKPGQEVEAWVSTRCNLSPAGGHQICTEEIQVVGYGEPSLAHFPALVRALLVPDLPVALVWLAEPPRKGRLLRELLRMSDRILIDSQPGGDESALPRIHELVRDTHAHFVDLAWMRLTPVRYMVASLFDGAGRAEQLRKVEAIRVEATPNGRSTGFLMLGWLLTRLGKLEIQAAEAVGGTSAYHWKAKLHSRTVPIEFAVHEGAGGYDGLISIEVTAGSDAFRMRQIDREHIALEGPDHGGQKLALHGWNDAELLMAGLGGPGIDALYPEALAMAATLIQAEAWNR